MLWVSKFIFPGAQCFRPCLRLNIVNAICLSLGSVAVLQNWDTLFSF